MNKPEFNCWHIAHCVPNIFGDRLNSICLCCSRFYGNIRHTKIKTHHICAAVDKGYQINLCDKCWILDCVLMHCFSYSHGNHPDLSESSVTVNAPLSYQFSWVVNPLWSSNKIEKLPKANLLLYLGLQSSLLSIEILRKLCHHSWNVLYMSASVSRRFHVDFKQCTKGWGIKYLAF